MKTLNKKFARASLFFAPIWTDCSQNFLIFFITVRNLSGYFQNDENNITGNSSKYHLFRRVVIGVRGSVRNFGAHKKAQNQEHVRTLLSIPGGPELVGKGVDAPVGGQHVHTGTSSHNSEACI